MKLVIDPHARNHFKVMLQGEAPEDEKEQILIAERLYNDLCKNGVVIYSSKQKHGESSIKGVELKDKYYIVVCIKNECGSYNNVIYEMTNKNDTFAVCKFFKQNIGTITADYKQQILDAKKMVVRKEENNGESRETIKSIEEEKN